MLYFFSCGLFKIVLKVFGRITGVEAGNLPDAGGVIIAPNHISYLDPPAVGVCTSRQVHFMAKEELFRPRFLGAWMHGVGSFPVKRGAADRRAIKRAIELLEQGKVVCIFPEGTRSDDGRLQSPELGIGLIALKSRAPVVPTLITGTDKVLPPHAKRLYFHRVRVIYGEPLTFTDLYNGPDSRRAMEEVGRRVMAAIARLSEQHSP